MKLLKTSCFFLLICITPILYAQHSPMKFGDINIDNLRLEKNPLDSSAGALVIMDFGKTTFDHNFKIILEHHIRIKIFNSSEFDRASVKIPYAAGDNVGKLKAVTYNLKGDEIIDSKLSRKDTYVEKVSDEVNQKRFSLPDVKEGSIIEYSYTVDYGSWVSLNPWYFQMSIPVLHSEYIVALPEYFYYKKLNTGYIPLDYNASSKRGQGASSFNVDVQQFIAKNVPAFKEEPFMTSREDYISKIQFQLSSIYIPGVYNEQVMPESYAALSKNYAESESFGKKLSKNKFLLDDIEMVTSGLTDPKDKIARIYHFVRDSFSIDYDVMSDNLKQIYKLKKGHPQDINMILIAMYNEAGLQANAVKLSTRGNGRLHPVYVMPSKFNYTVCIVSDGEKEYLLDASKKNLPFNVLDKSCLNGKGMVVTAENFRWVDLMPRVDNRSVIFAQLEMSASGELKGTLNLSRTGYKAIEFRTKNKENLQDYKKTLSEKYVSWTISDHKIEGMETIEEMLKEKIELESESYAQSLGNIIYLTPIFYGRVSTNPLRSRERLFPVNYGSPVEEHINYTIKIPEGYIIEEMPEQLAIGLPNNAGRFIYSVGRVGDYINVVSKININKVEFSTQEYQYLREFYAQVVEKQAEQIVLKKNI